MHFKPLSVFIGGGDWVLRGRGQFSRTSSLLPWWIPGMELRSSCLAAGAFADQIISLTYIIKLKHKLVFLHLSVHSIHLNQSSLPLPLLSSVCLSVFPSISFLVVLVANPGFSPMLENQSRLKFWYYRFIYKNCLVFLAFYYGFYIEVGKSSLVVLIVFKFFSPP